MTSLAQFLGNQNKRSVRAEPAAGKEKCCCRGKGRSKGVFFLLYQCLLFDVSNMLFMVTQFYFIFLHDSK